MTPTPLLLGISGPSSSGKTTLSRLLRDILPTSFILHLDDFYLPDSQIPVHAGLQDWDCLGSLDLPAFLSALEHIKSQSTPPPSVVSKEDQNSVADSGVSDKDVEAWKAKVRETMKEVGWEEQRTVAIIDGFLLFSEEMVEIRDMFDVKLFLPTVYETAKRRREARSGYVTLEGFWEDPPGYVDKIVWPNYAKDHKFLFEKGDVNANLNEAICRRVGITGMPIEAQDSMKMCLDWAMKVLEQEFQRRGGLETRRV